MEPMEIFRALLLLLLICCAVGAGLSKRLLTSVIIFMSYSGIMAIVWALLQSPDLAITEAAVGAGVSSILFFMCLRRIGGTEKSETEVKRNSGEERDTKVPFEDGRGLADGDRKNEGDDGDIGKHQENEKRIAPVGSALKGGERKTQDEPK